MPNLTIQSILYDGLALNKGSGAPNIADLHELNRLLDDIRRPFSVYLVRREEDDWDCDYSVNEILKAVIEHLAKMFGKFIKAVEDQIGQKIFDQGVVEIGFELHERDTSTQEGQYNPYTNNGWHAATDYYLHVLGNGSLIPETPISTYLEVAHGVKKATPHTPERTSKHIDFTPIIGLNDDESSFLHRSV